MDLLIRDALKNIPVTSHELISNAKSLTNTDQWCIILVNAGHFAFAIYKGLGHQAWTSYVGKKLIRLFNLASDEIIVHKTFHRYVIRAKNGTVQSTHDSSGKHARSAGANIRRHHEAAFKEVRDRFIPIRTTRPMLSLPSTFARKSKHFWNSGKKSWTSATASSCEHPSTTSRYSSPARRRCSPNTTHVYAAYRL